MNWMNRMMNKVNDRLKKISKSANEKNRIMTCLDWTVMTGNPFCSVQVFMTASTGYSGPLAASSSAHSWGVSVFWGKMEKVICNALQTISGSVAEP